jgi:hypothetical protein
VRPFHWCSGGRLTRRAFVVGALFATGPASAIGTQNIKFDAAWIADLNIQPEVGSSFSVDTSLDLHSSNLWLNTIVPLVNRFASLLSIGSPPFKTLAIDDTSRPGYAAVDGKLRDDPRYQGILLIGQQMTDLLRTSFLGVPYGVAIAGAIAHEMAHLYQFRFSPEDSRTWWTIMLDDDAGFSRQRVELHADFLAGWLLGQSPTAMAGYIGIDIFARRLYELGDFDGADPNHHGTPQQRYAAMLRGFFLGRNDKMPLQDAASEGRVFVNAIVPMRQEL